MTNWSAIEALADAVGAAGVIISLVYLAYQVRQNTKAAKAATRQALADGAQALASDVVEVDDIARIMQDVMDGKSIQPHERFRIQARCLRDLRFWDNAFYQYTEGLLTDAEWEGFRVNLALIFQFPFYREYWDQFQVMFSAPFRDEVNRLLESERPIDMLSAFTDKRSAADESVGGGTAVQ